MKRSLILTSQIIISLASFVLPCAAQVHHDFIPLSTFGEYDKELIVRIKYQVDEEIVSTNSPRQNEINKVYQVLGKRMRMMVVRNEFIHNDSLQHFVETISRQIIQHNTVRFPPKLILIQNNPFVNAMASPDGTLIIYSGLIGNIKNESQLAFAIAHEMAHFELQHPRKQITAGIEDGLFRKEMKNLRDLSGDNASAENMENLKKIWYYRGNDSRMQEREADAMAFDMITNAGYAQQESITLLDILNQSQLEKVDMDFMFQLNLDDYPLKDEWFRKRPSLFSKKRESVFFEEDSIISHPDIELRKELLRERINDRSQKLNQQPDQRVYNIIETSALQSIQAAFDRRNYDLCLYKALKLRSKHPEVPYLTTTIAKVFAGLYERRYLLYDFYRALPSYTVGYNEELRMVNEFLHNINKEELGEVAYHFLAGKNFDENCEEHYYQLWRICSMTNRKSERKKIKAAYEHQFVNGKYRNDMVSYTAYKTTLRQDRKRGFQ